MLESVKISTPKVKFTMTEQSPEKTTRLWAETGFREDEWNHAETSDALSGNSRIILPLAEFLALDDETRRNAKDRLGVVLQPGEQLDEIVSHLDTLSLVALAFPVYSDGRSYSKAELLRSRHGFEGAVRAVGDVLVDQLPHMLRVGFDEFEISNPVLLKRLEEGRVGGIAQQYQPTAKQSEKTANYSWRRLRAPN
jgi:uncharacterized protein (DUF934 family)